MPDDQLVTVYVSIGNSDDKLSQHDWSDYAAAFVDTVNEYAEQIHGVWYSASDSPFQNACVCAEVHPAGIDDLRAGLTRVRTEFGQDSVAWAPTTGTEFI